MFFQIRKDEGCTSKNPRFLFDHSRHYCTMEKGKDRCHGDSGGALFYKDTKTDTIYQVGIVSGGGSTCGETKYASIYTRVTAHYNWMMPKMPSAKWCHNPKWERIPSTMQDEAQFSSSSKIFVVYNQHSNIASFYFLIQLIKLFFSFLRRFL